MIYPTGTITIEELQSIKLPVVNFAEGYKVAEVDVFLGKCADTLRNGYGLSAEEVAALLHLYVYGRICYRRRGFAA